MNYQQDDQTEWLSTAEFQYNNKRHVVIVHTPFELNFGRHLWKGDLIIKTEMSRLKKFLKELQGSWGTAKKSMEIAKEAMKRQFDKKRRNS